MGHIVFYISIANMCSKHKAVITGECICEVTCHASVCLQISFKLNKHQTEVVTYCAGCTDIQKFNINENFILDVDFGVTTANFKLGPPVAGTLSCTSTALRFCIVGWDSPKNSAPFGSSGTLPLPLIKQNEDKMFDKTSLLPKLCYDFDVWNRLSILEDVNWMLLSKSVFFVYNFMYSAILLLLLLLLLLTSILTCAMSIC